MRIVWSLLCIALMGLCFAGRQASASDGFEDVAKLAKSGVTEDVLVQFIKTSSVAFDLTVDEILYLTDLGVTPKAISAIVDHAKDIRAGKQPEAATEATAEVVGKTIAASTTAALDQDAEDAAANGAPANAATGDTTQTPGPLAEGEGDGKLIFASPLSSAVLTEQESVKDTVAAPVPVAAPEEGAVTTATFYETLTPYGTWIRIDDSWCWQPTVTVSDPEWQPYCDRGHWASTDCGWFWQSDYSWGWAPFHYGRWKRCAGYGWLWTPDTVWSPAWVSWRECDSHYGWAPLPPACGFDLDLGFRFGGRHSGVDIGFGLGLRDFCFVSSNHFCEFSLRRHRIPRHECGTIFNRTTIIQNNITVVNSRVTVNGPRFDRVQNHAGRNIPQLRIADAHIGAGQALNRTAHEDRRNGVLQIYRPQVKTAVNDTPATIAKKQLASHVAQTKISSDPKILAASQKADDIRARQLAAQESRKQTAESLQRSRLQGTALKTAEFEQQKLQKALGQEQDAKRKADLAAKLDAQRTQAENARKQKQDLEAKAADARKHTLELAQERDRALKAKATADNARLADDNKARLEAQRKSQQEAKQAQLEAQRKAQQDNAARQAQENKLKLDAQRREADARQTQLENQRKLQADAAKQAQLESQRKLQQDASVKQAQLEAQRRAQQEAASARQAQLESQRKLQQDASVKQAQLEAQRRAQQEAASARQAQLESQRKAQQDAASARQAQVEAQRQAQKEAQLRSSQNNNPSRFTPSGQKSTNNQNDDPFSPRRRRN